MRTIEVEFWVSTNYVGSEYKETVEILVEEEATEKEIEDEIDYYYKDWVNNNTDQGWAIIEQS